MKVILISGYKRSGKDYVAHKLRELISNSRVIALAKPLKDIIATTMGISKDDLDKFKNHSAEVCVVDDETLEYFYNNNFRTMLQKFGTEAMKKWFGDNVWVDLAIKRATELTESGVETIIISDWRFTSEYEAFKRVAHVRTIRVEDNNLTGDGHISEHDLDEFKFDDVIDNTIKDGTLTLPQKW